MSESRMEFFYDKRTKEFEVWFKDRTKRTYLNVPKNIADQAMKADSKGQFFNAHIRDIFNMK